MSFKRDGDDFSLLHCIQTKRVTELLGEHVPEDEAKLLSNGRLTCLICSHRPIFDSMKTLVIHRRGKKHLYELSIYLEQKQNHEFKNLKQKHLDSVRKEMALKANLLGPKEMSKSKSINPFERKKAIALKLSKEADRIPVKSLNGQVRTYLKEISKKTPLAAVVEIKKESYPDSSVVPEDVLPEDSPPPPSKKRKLSSTKELLDLHMSGYVRDKFGNLVRDPEAEFDSDDD